MSAGRGEQKSSREFLSDTWNSHFVSRVQQNLCFSLKGHRGRNFRVYDCQNPGGRFKPNSNLIPKSWVWQTNVQIKFQWSLENSAEKVSETLLFSAQNRDLWVRKLDFANVLRETPADELVNTFLPYRWAQHHQVCIKFHTGRNPAEVCSPEKRDSNWKFIACLTQEFSNVPEFLFAISTSNKKPTSSESENAAN